MIPSDGVAPRVAAAVELFEDWRNLLLHSDDGPGKRSLTETQRHGGDWGLAGTRLLDCAEETDHKKAAVDVTSVDGG